MNKNLSNIYDVVKNKRGKTKQGFVRPTICEFFTNSTCGFEEITSKIILIGYTDDLCTNLSNVTESSIYGLYGGTPPRPGSNAFDGSLLVYSNHWQTAGEYEFPQWLKYDFGINDKKTINKYTLQTVNITDLYAPKNWTFEGSNDDTNWTTLDTQTNQTNWPGEEKKEFTFDNITEYQYYRWYFTQNNSGYCLIIGEAEMMGGIYE